MEVNKEEALRALAIAQRHRNEGNYTSARRFTAKSIRLFSTTEAEKLLAAIDREENASTSSAPSAQGGTGNASGVGKNASAGSTRQRHANGESSNADKKPREYTADNEKVVKRVQACKVTDYYGILALKRDCEENDVKRAYRKLALQLHPDKNGAPGADEAFKLVSKAFQVLSDDQKRSAYDRHGDDPDSRFSGMSSSPAGFGRGGGGGMAFEGEISPEDLFNMFFGGGAMGGNSPFGGGGGFGAGPGVFTASFGPGGFRTTRMGGGGQPRQTPGRGNTESNSSMLLQLLPLVLLFAFSFLNALPSLFSGPSVPDPSYSFSASSTYATERTTSNLGIRYFVNDASLRSHPVIGSEIKQTEANPSNSRLGKGMRQLEDNVEHRYTNKLYSTCRQGVERKERRKEKEIGFMGIGTDWDKVRSIEAEVIPECDELRRLGLLQ